MTNQVENGPPKHGIRLALIIGVVWAAVLGVLWYLTRGDALGKEDSALMIFLGRFHPLVVHLPIGLILLVPILELLGARKSWAHLKQTVPLVLWLIVFGSLISTVFGFVLMKGEQVESVLMTRHLWTGIAVGVLAVFTLVLKLLGEGQLYAVSLTASVIAVMVTGHFGGALVHGKNYLATYAPEPLKPLLTFGFGESSAPETEAVAAAATEPADEIPMDDKVVFTHFIMPVMEAKCTECHNEEKTKGKLRLDTHELILAGVEGADYPNVAPGDSDDSELIYRVTIEPEDDDFMPPDGKDPLTAEEIKLIRWWIDNGASAEMTVAEANADDDMVEILLAVEAELEGDEEAAAALAEAGPISEWDLLSPDERTERLDSVMAAAEQFNFSVMPISAEDDRLRVNVINAARDFGDEQLEGLSPVAERIVWLDLARSQVTDEGMDIVGKMRNLERLHLENTAITDAGVAKLGRLTKIEYLNLYGTAVTDAIFETLAGMGDLRKLFLWQTKVDPAAARIFQKQMSLEVNTGYELAAAESEEPVEAGDETAAATETEPPAEPKPTGAGAASASPADAKPAAKPQPGKKERPESPKPQPKPNSKAKPAEEKKPAS